MLPKTMTYGDQELQIEDRRWLGLVSLLLALVLACGVVVFFGGDHHELMERPVPRGESVDFSDVSAVLADNGAFRLVQDPPIGNWRLENKDGETIGLLIKVEAR